MPIHIPKEQQQRLAAKVDFTQVWCGIKRFPPSWSGNDIKNGKSWFYLHWIMSLSLCWWEPFSMNTSMRIPLPFLIMTSHLIILCKEIQIHHGIIPLYLRQLEFMKSKTGLKSVHYSQHAEEQQIFEGGQFVNFPPMTCIYLQQPSLLQWMRHEILCRQAWRQIIATIIVR